MPSKQIGPSKWAVWYSKRNPKTGQAVTLRRHVNTKAAIAREERKLIADVERKILEKTVPSWNEIFRLYLEDCRNRGLAESTVYNIDKCLTASTIRRWGARPITMITTQEIRELIQYEYADRSQSHQKSLLKFIRQAMQYAMDRGDIHRNPTPRLTFRIGDKIKKVLTEEQVRIFLNQAKAIDWEWFPHCTMALYTGMRNGELYALTWDKVALEDRQILVDCAWSSKDGFKSTKSGDDRIVEIAEGLMPVMNELKLMSAESHFVLPRSREWDIGDQARHLRKFLLGIGLPEIRFHDLRASWATIMMSKGVPPIKVMAMGGWKDLKTMQIYMRKAGVDVKGITSCLNLHNHHEGAKVLDFIAKS